MPESMVREFMAKGLSRKKAEEKTMRIVNSKKKHKKKRKRGRRRKG